MGPWNCQVLPETHHVQRHKKHAQHEAEHDGNEDNTRGIFDLRLAFCRGGVRVLVLVLLRHIWLAGRKDSIGLRVSHGSIWALCAKGVEVGAGEGQIERAVAGQDNSTSSITSFPSVSDDERLSVEGSGLKVERAEGFEKSTRKRPIVKYEDSSCVPQGSKSNEIEVVELFRHRQASRC